MRITAKPIMIGVPAVMVTVLVAVLALWAWGPIGASGGGASSNATLLWNVEYWHHNADGELLQHKIDHNTLTDKGLDAAMNRLLNQTVVTELGATDAFDKIVLLGASDPASDGFLAGSILLAADGTNEPGDTVANNPALGEFADVTADDGAGTITVTFVAEDDGVAALQMGLVKTVALDTFANTEVDIVAADILASLDITVTLATDDTLTITWTVDADAS